MLKKTNFVLLFIFAAMCLFAQTADKPVLVVTPIDLYNVEQKTGDMLTRRMQSEFSQTMKFTVVDRNSFDKIRAEQEFQEDSDWSSPDKIAALQKAFNAQYIVTSSVENYNNELYVVTNIIDVNSTVIIASENSKSGSVGELMSGGIKDLVTKTVSHTSAGDMSAEIAKKPVIVLSAFDLFDVDEKNGNLLLRIMQSEFSKTKQFVVVDRKSFEKILEEHNFQKDSEWSNPEKISALKKAFNAKYIVTTSIDNGGDILYITSNIIDVNSTAINASMNSDVKGVNELLNGNLKTIVENIAAQINPSFIPIYEIGEKGPGGGIVFYASKSGFTLKNSTKTYHYLECSDVLSSKITWCSFDWERYKNSDYKNYCCKNDELLTETGFGYGKYNTSRIVNGSHRHGSVGVYNCAAMLCAKYTTPTTKAGDWWLPSKDELNLIYTNLKCKGYISDSSYFWSSSSYNNTDAWDQDFSSGSQYYDYEYGQSSVRAVRAF